MLREDRLLRAVAPDLADALLLPGDGEWGEVVVCRARLRCERSVLCWDGVMHEWDQVLCQLIRKSREARIRLCEDLTLAIRFRAVVRSLEVRSPHHNGWVALGLQVSGVARGDSLTIRGCTD